jgi:hypothetical protein
MGKAYGRITYKTLFGKAEGKRPLVKPRHSWNNNIKMDIRDGRLLIKFIWLGIGSNGPTP